MTINCKVAPAPQNNVVTIKEICPNLSTANNFKQPPNSFKVVSGLTFIGFNSALVLGTYKLKNAAKIYKNVTIKIFTKLACGFNDFKNSATLLGNKVFSTKFNKAIALLGSTKVPPKTTPKTIAPTVNPSIQPLATTNNLCGKYSVRIPYFAGEYIAAPKPTTA